jgi:acyl carrier protein
LTSAPHHQEKTMKTQQELITLFKQVATEVDKREFRDVTGESVISDLGIDSLSMMQIVGEMELRLNVMIPDEDLVELVTVEDLLKVVARRLERA